MKLNSLNTVLAMTAAIGIAFVGISCKPKEEASGDAPKEVKKMEGEVKKEAKKADDAVKEEVKKEEAK